MFGNPKTNPKSEASLRSPPPMPLPLVIKTKIRKNKKAPIPDKMKFKGLGFKPMNKKDTARVGYIILSGIIPYFKSVKKTTIREEIKSK